MSLLGKEDNLTNWGQYGSEQSTHENYISLPELKGNQNESQEKQTVGLGKLNLTILTCLFQYKMQVWLGRQRIDVGKNELSK